VYRAQLGDGLGDWSLSPESLQKHAHTQKAGFLWCGERGAKGENFGPRPPNANPFIPVVPKTDPRAGGIELAIMLFWPDLIWNHQFDKRFIAIGNLLANKETPLLFAFPLDQLAVTDEMIDHAIGLLKSGKLQKIQEESGISVSQALTETASYAAAGGQVGGWIGAGVGAAIGALKSIFSFGFGHKEWDTPDELDDYVKKMQQIRGKGDLCWHFSHGDDGKGCAYLWIGPCKRDVRGASAPRTNPTPAYTLLDGLLRLKAKLAGQSIPGVTTPSATTPAPAPVPAGGPIRVAPAGGPITAPTAAAPAGCAFVVGGNRFPCTQQGWAAAMRTARTMPGQPAIMQYGASTVNMRRCLQVMPAGGTPMIPAPASGFAPPTQAPAPGTFRTQAPAPGTFRRATRRRPRRALRGLGGIGALDRQNISALTEPTHRIDWVAIAIAVAGAAILGVSALGFARCRARQRLQQ
jgi:hypothetical protein